jgi:hypothetical protein
MRYIWIASNAGQVLERHLLKITRVDLQKVPIDGCRCRTMSMPSRIDKGVSPENGISRAIK